MPSPTGIVRLLFVIQLVSMGAMEMSGPFWPLRLKEIGTADAVFGLASTGTYVAPMLGIALSGGLWGRMGDRYGHKPMMMRALAALALTQLGLAFAHEAGMIVLLRFVQGACAGFQAPAQAYGVGLVPDERRSRLFACLQVSTNVGSLGGAVLGGVILDHARFVWINAAATGLCLACGLAVLTLLPAGPAIPRALRAAEPPAVVWRNPVIARLLLAHGGLIASRLMPQMPFALYVRDTFGVENWVVGLCYGLMAAGFIASAALWARAFEGLSRRRALAGIAGVAVACAATVLAAGTTAHVAVFAASYALWGVLLGATTPILTGLISREAAAHQQGRILGIVQGTTQAAAMAGVAVGGAVTKAAGTAYVFPLASVLYLAACGLLLRVRQS